MNRVAFACIVFCSVLFWGLSLSPACAAEKKNILILNSYHQGYKWTDEETRGIIEALGPQRDAIKFYIDYMDTKLSFDTQYLNLLRETYKLKFKNILFDVIIATDNDAFNFLRLHRDETFGKVPVVFCGVNWFKQEDLHGYSRYTGVNEDADIATNLDLMLKLHPRVRHIYIVADLTTTGRIIHQKIEQLVPKYRDRLNIHLLDDLEMPQILSTVSKLHDDSLVFLTIYQQDKTGAFFEYAEIAELLSQNSTVPVYGLWDFHLGHGIVGGRLTCGHAQGSSAGALALRILAGESPNSIPVIMESPNKYLFDYTQLKRFGLLNASLPQERRIINEPPSFYALNKGLFWGMVIGISGLAAALVALLFYIRSRRKAEVNLRQSEARYHSLVDNLTLGIYRTTGDPDGTFLQANPAMAKMFGFDSPEELLLVSTSSLYQKSDERPQVMEEILRSGFLKNKEVLMQRKDGETVWVSINAKAHRDENGRIDWIDGIFEDITDKKQLEIQLRQSQKMEAIGTLAGGVAHDFNNILTAIIGYGSLLKKKAALEGATMNYLDALLSSAEKAAQLTKSLLAFSRKQIISLKPANLNDIVEGMSQLLFRVIGEDIELSFRLHPQPLSIMVDSGQIEQVLLNLVTNARDAMPTGGVLCISTERIVLRKELMIKHELITPGDYAVLSVSDSGAGMSDDVRLRIFEPFFSTKAIGKGTGLGLAIVYGIVKQHYGDISVYSESNKGTTFKIYLPITHHSEQKQEPVHHIPATGGTETILVAEDSDDVRNLAREILTYGGYRVILAVDGEDAVVKFEKHADEIDLVLLDVVMPRKNGKEVHDTIKALNPDIKVLFMSGYTADIIHQKGILEEGIRFISKPLTPDTLLRKIREVLSESD